MLEFVELREVQAGCGGGKMIISYNDLKISNLDDAWSFLKDLVAKRENFLRVRGVRIRFP